MSTLAERARMEAEETEAAEEEETPTEPDEPTEPEPEPAPEPPASQMTEQEAEREFKKLEKLAQTYIVKAMAIADRLGIPYQPCPLDYMPGLAVPRAEHEVTSDVESAVLALIGKSPTPEFKSSEGYRVCDICDGWGEVLTGARKDISRTATCPNPNCGGKGYITVPIVVAPPNGQATYPGASEVFTPLLGGIPDQWGRPAGHVHWGIDPANVGA
jgi:hypothetical protein